MLDAHDSLETPSEPVINEEPSDSDPENQWEDLKSLTYPPQP